MASTSVFNLTRFTALASGDVIPVVDISDTAQSAHGSLDSITALNFFAFCPSASSTFGATTLPAGVSGLYPTLNLFGLMPDTNTNAARRSVFVTTGFGASPVFAGVRTGGTVTIPTATVLDSALVGLDGGGYDGTAYGIQATISFLASETWSVGNHGTYISFQNTATGAASRSTCLTLRQPTAGVTQLVPAATSLSLRNNANNADNLIILDAGGATFRSTVKATAYQPINTGTVVNDATVAIGNPDGLVLVYDAQTGAGVIIVARGGSGAQPVILVQDALGEYTVTSGSANKTNIYVTGGALTIENKNGGNVNYNYTKLTP